MAKSSVQHSVVGSLPVAELSGLSQQRTVGNAQSPTVGRAHDVVITSHNPLEKPLREVSKKSHSHAVAVLSMVW